MHVGDIQGERKRARADRWIGRACATLPFAGFLALVVPTLAFAGDSDSDGADFFEAQVRPVLVEHCYHCHSARARSLKGGLRLDSLVGMRKGGEQGPALVPGDVEGSLLIQAVRYKDEALRMPPKGKLPDATIASLEQWVKGGAVGPHAVADLSSNPVVNKSAGIDFEAARRHWAYQPVRRPRAPRCEIMTGRSQVSMSSSWHGWKRPG